MVTPYLGEIVIYPYEQAPAGWLPCDGRMLQMNHYAGFYAVIRNKFGGDGKTTFGIPDLREIAPYNSQYYIASEGVFPPLY